MVVSNSLITCPNLRFTEKQDQIVIMFDKENNVAIRLNKNTLKLEHRPRFGDVYKFDCALAEPAELKEDDSLDLKSAKKELIEESQKEESQKEEGPKKGEKEEIPNETESGKEINPAVNNKDKSFLVKYGDTIVDNTCCCRQCRG